MGPGHMVHNQGSWAEGKEVANWPEIIREPVDTSVPPLSHPTVLARQELLQERESWRLHGGGPQPPMQ